jgi:hypothetical protein
MHMPVDELGNVNVYISEQERAGGRGRVEE